MSTIKVFQLNCHNAFQAHTELGILMAKHSGTVALIQEPYVNGRKTLANLPKGYDSFPSEKTGHKRTLVLASKHLKLTEINELCTNICTVIGGVIEGRKIIFASIYMHYDSEIISPELEKLIQYAKENCFQLVIGADSNAHSNLWGPEPTHNDPRGEQLEEFILKHSLKVENIGCFFLILTFYRYYVSYYSNSCTHIFEDSGFFSLKWHNMKQI